MRYKRKYISNNQIELSISHCPTRAMTFEKCYHWAKENNLEVPHETPRFMTDTVLV